MTATTNRQKGMTLIELSVVLLIMVALASVAINYFSDYANKTFYATSGRSIIEVKTAIDRFYISRLRYPNNLNSLIEFGQSAQPNYIDNRWLLNGNSNFAAVQLSELGARGQAGLQSLQAAGIKRVAMLMPGTTTIQSGGRISNNMSDPHANASFANEINNIPLTLNSWLTVQNPQQSATLSLPTLLNYKSNNPASIFVVFGVGEASDLSHNTLINAPVIFSADASLQSEHTYGRFLAIFDVDISGQNNPARCIGVLIANDTQAGWLNQAQIQRFYQ
jgi:prepilin-type N-terminal cleavage/methylation domain-containing protein